MSAHPTTRASWSNFSGVRVTASPVDHALTLFLADETEAALRWGAAALERDPLWPSALVVTARLLDQMGRSRAAIDGLRLATTRAISTGDLPLAMAAIDDLRILGADVGEQLDQLAGAFCRGSGQAQPAQLAQVLPQFTDFLEPLSPFLAGPRLASRATQIVQAAKHALESSVGAEPPPFAPLPLFGSLSKEALREFLASLQMITVPAGHRIILEGEEGDAAYIVAHGEVEISQRASRGDNKPRLALASLGSGAFFGEMALLSRLPSATSVTATRPSILLVGKRDALAAIAARRPELAVALAAHCRRNSLANLGWRSPVVAAIPDEERATLVERLQMRVFERGEKLVADKEDPRGLHLIVSGEVAIVAREWSERVLLATLGAGETVGEVELVLCRQAYADAIAVRPTAALFLSREDYSALVEDRPAILHGLYATAVRRHAETRLALEAGSATVADEWLLEDEPTHPFLVPDAHDPGRILPPAPPPSRVAAGERTFTTPDASPFPTSSGQRFLPGERRERPTATPHPPSIAPTSASVAPSQFVPPAQRSAASLVLAAGAVLVASAAGVLAVVALRAGHPGATEAVRTAATSAPTLTAPIAPAAATTAPAANPAPPTNATVVPPTKPALKPAAPKPAPARLAASTLADAGVHKAEAPVPSSASSAPPAAAAPRWAAARAVSSADDFGGRE